MKKISILTLHLGYGGIEKATSDLANLFSKEYDVEILCLYPIPIAYKINPKVKITYLMEESPNHREFKEAVRDKNIVKIMKEGLKAVRILRRKSKVLKKAIQSLSNQIIISTRNEFNVLLSQYGNDSNLRIAQLHHDLYYDAEKTLIYDLKNSYQNIDVLTVLSEQLVDEINELFKGRNTKTQCIFVPNYIDLTKQKDIKKENIVIAVGRLNKVKGFDRLIKMFKEMDTSWKLWIVGDGGEYHTLNQMIQGDPRIALLGKKDPSEVENLLNKASIYAMTSHSEGFPYVLLEAIDARLPIIAFDVRIGPKAIMGQQGILIENDDQEAFKNHLQQLMENESLRNEISRNLYQRAVLFSSDHVYRLYTSIFNKNR